MDAASGFSLVELLFALIIAGILAAIALPGWTRLLPSYHLDSSVRQVQSELHSIKMRAAAENATFQLSYGTGASDYTIRSGSSALATRPLPPGIVITKAGAVLFYPRGTASANRVRLRNAEGMCRQVVVSATGRVRVCQPDDCNSDC
ncbi:MAG TPA: GspH/FimT family pseudopilin [candidate division Zixibacteria bacterium]|nr:GspH/FimT family pseudopilin [candidate division Zixibacteria bacterium]